MTPRRKVRPLTRPCNDCPFRITGGIRLEPGRAREIAWHFQQPRASIGLPQHRGNGPRESRMAHEAPSTEGGTMSRKCGRRGGSLRRGNEMTGRRSPDSQPGSYSSERVLVYYQLPDGSVVRVDDSAAKGAPTIDFTLAGGEIVTAVRVRVTAANDELLSALKLLLKAYNDLMPGIVHIAVPDYALLNDAPIAARRAIAKAERKVT